MTDETGVFLLAACEAAEQAGALIRNSWEKAKSIEYKGVIDLVTPVDRESERRIVETLRDRFPEHSILAEEETNLAGGHPDHCWIIDPLDGTTNFAHTYPCVSISIALQHEGSTVVGVVYDPLRQERFSAVKGKGATLNGGVIKVSAVEELDKALLATGFPYDRREQPDYYLAFFKAFMLRAQGIRRSGSAALDLCYLACGRLDGFWELKLRPWDTAAASLIVKEAGGKVSGFSGAEFSIWGDETLASNGVIHDEMIGVASTVNNQSPSR